MFPQPSWTKTAHRPGAKAGSCSRRLTGVIAVAPLVLTASLLATNTQPAQSRETGKTTMLWDVAADFVAAPNQANPNPDQFGNSGVWTFLSAPLNHDPAGYQR